MRSMCVVWGGIKATTFRLKAQKTNANECDRKIIENEITVKVFKSRRLTLMKE